jgi:hypothetical protein
MAGDREIRIAALSACLSLVRPVGMTEAETIDWLKVAADTLSHIPAHILERGARAARAKCTHHAQIVPTIVAETRDALDLYNRPRRPAPLRLVAPARPIQTETPPDPETLMPSLRRMGLERGWLVERDGRLEWSEGDAA